MQYITIVEPSGEDDEVPRKFKEKKERYGRDPRKLYETYQEEWDRLERLSDRKWAIAFVVFSITL